jgi:hypothetical protein
MFNKRLKSTLSPAPASAGGQTPGGASAFVRRPPPPLDTPGTVGRARTAPPDVELHLLLEHSNAMLEIEAQGPELANEHMVGLYRVGQRRQRSLGGRLRARGLHGAKLTGIQGRWAGFGRRVPEYLPVEQVEVS